MLPYRIYFLVAIMAAILGVCRAQSRASGTPSAASNLPDISVIGDAQGWFNNGPNTDGNNTLQLNELETVIGGKIYPGIRGDAVISLPAPDFTPELEEGYASFDQITHSLPVGARVGVVRLPFGKANPVHPHAWPYADTPLVTEHLLGEFRGNGFEVVGLVPTHSKLFIQAQLGRWTSLGDPADGAGFRTDEPLTLGRLWTGTSVSANSEVELGFSGATGKGVASEAGGASPDITILGTDATYRRWLPRGRRLLVQGEAMTRKDAAQRRSGYYLMTTFRPDRDHEFGVRLDRSDLTDDIPTHASGVSVFSTHYLNEMTYLRMEGTHGKDGAGQAVNTVGVQVVFGFGPHSHPLQ
jgi:hypothetical protein